ncbi:MAG: CcmD family protein, partial [Methanosarcinales archaeon]|nr:CcmD family protein [Methanosarcinales archaeon]
ISGLNISSLIISPINTCRFDIVETLISNLVYARSMLTAFGIVWVVFLVYIFMLLQTRKQLNRQMELLGHLKD